MYLHSLHTRDHRIKFTFFPELAVDGGGLPALGDGGTHKTSRTKAGIMQRISMVALRATARQVIRGFALVGAANVQAHSDRRAEKTAEAAKYINHLADPTVNGFQIEAIVLSPFLSHTLYGNFRVRPWRNVMW